MDEQNDEEETPQSEPVVERPGSSDQPTAAEEKSDEEEEIPQTDRPQSETVAARPQSEHFFIRLLSDAEKFEIHLQKFRAKVAGDKGKFNLMIAAQQGTILSDPLETALKKITGKQGESDFQIISVVRLLFLGDNAIPAIADAKKRIVSALDSFPFWPANSKNNNPNFDKIVFWSENHLIMTLGSCYLFRQYKLNPEARAAAPETQKVILGEMDSTLETKLLKIYLRAHCLKEFNGVYEVNSSVYLPYTLSGLLNLYDFAVDDEIRQMAGKIIDRVIHHVMLCTTSDGTNNLSAGGRTFVRTRLRTHGHNINQLANLIVGRSPDDMYPSAITDYLLTTTWRPKFDEVKQALEFTGAHPIVPLSHPVASTREMYTKLAAAEGVDAFELIPLYWSAGLVTHPDFVADTRTYLHAKGMNKNENLSALTYFSAGYLARNMAHYSTISRGQMYTNIALNVFKHPQQQLVLSSFENFNAHCASFQQLPWIANVSGLGVWSQSGSGGESLFNFGMTNTHNPFIKQKGSVLIASYVTPNALRYRFIMGSLFTSSVRLFWPLDLFSEWCSFLAPTDKLFVSNQSPSASNPMVTHRLKEQLVDDVQKAGTWCAARKGDAYIGVYCSQKSKMDFRASKDAEMKPTPDSKAVQCPRRVCDQYRHSWLVVVGSTKDYPTLDVFVDMRCRTMAITEVKGGSGSVGAKSKYEFHVCDDVEGPLENVIALPT